MERGPHLLIVADDREIRMLISCFLGKHGFRISAVADGRAMMRGLAESQVDLIVLDVMLPDEDGLTLCRRIRAQSAVPIIMLAALGEDTDRIIGLEMGADDCLPKPVNPRELLARIRGVLRRTSPPQADRAAARIFSFEGWRLDLGLRQLRGPAGALVALTTGEFDLLVAFCEHPRRVLTRGRLLDLTHGKSAEALDRSVDIRVSRLRRKIERDAKAPTLIATVRSGGYFFTPEVRRE
jgi:two-component system, OmpR family, response regulator